jgi:hypothetical protein
MSQTTQILNHLKEGNTLSPLEALDMFGCLRLGARIWELRHGEYDGTCYDITEEPHEGKQYAIYRLREHKQINLI